ncbi:MAG: cardiolipin synthase [Rikenellaceae bacterium]|nr:cardiolipin synthase [Rikenellaceae bacterium]
MALYPATILMTEFKAILTLVYVLFVAFTIVVIVHDKRDPVKALAWITVIALVPVVGFVFYIVFGRNHRKEKLFSRKELRDQKQLERMTQRQLGEINDSNVLQKRLIADNRDIITLLLNNSKALLTVRNRVTILNNGKETFASIIEALKAARSSIHLEYYIFANDKLGKLIARILMRKAREGVEVRFIYDDVGSWGLSPKFIHRLRKAGVEVRCFMPVAFPWLTSKINYRNHRKIVVVDGTVAFTGGINIAERYMGRSKKLGMWRDTHLRVEGEAAHMLQSVFITDWFFVSHRQPDNPAKYFPRVRIKDECLMQIVTSGPDSDWASIMQAFFAAITKAQKHIYIASPYFLPNEAILTAVKVASLSGIDVRVMIPSRSDSRIVYWASRSYISELLDAKVKIYLYKKGFNHSKLIMIDGVFSSVGSANMDIRSFDDNFEVSAIMYDAQITAQLEAEFINDLNDCEFVTPESWDDRPARQSIYEAFSRLFSPLL